MSVVADILLSFRAPRAVLRRLAGGERREARILVYLMIACVLIFVAQWPRLARVAHLDDAIPMEALLSGALFGWVFVMPLFLYALAGLMALVLRVVVRGADGFAVRLALFWALLVASLPALLQGMVMGVIGPGLEASLTGGLVVVVFLAVLIAGLRTALEAPPAEA